jgi:hypothetical protein
MLQAIDACGNKLAINLISGVQCQELAGDGIAVSLLRIGGE